MTSSKTSIVASIAGVFPLLTSSRLALPASIAFTAIFSVCIPLLDLRAVFYNDWINHVWTIQYFGEFFKENSRMPVEVNTAQVVGMPFALFYAQKFYAVVGFFSAIVGAPFSIRAFVVVVLAIAFLEVYQTLFLVARKGFCLFIAVCVVTQTYLLTDLYNRSALTEFFALVMIACALMSIWKIILQSNSSQHISGWVRTALYYSAASCTHPLTALFGGIFLSIIVLASFVTMPRVVLLRHLCGSALCAVVSLSALAPWIYITTLYRKSLPANDPIVLAGMFRKAGFYPSDIDGVLSRIWLLPSDPRIVSTNLEHVSTPYLDAQLSAPLGFAALGLLLLNLFQSRTNESSISVSTRITLASASFVTAIVALIVSIHPSISGYVGGFFDVLQFPYRLTGYINLGILSAIVALADRWPARSWSTTLLLANLLLVIVGVTVKLKHAFAIRTLASVNQHFEVSRPLWTVKSDTEQFANWVPLTWGTYKNLKNLPTTYYGAEPYSVLEGFGYVPVQSTLFDTDFISIPVKANPTFGTTLPKNVNFRTPTLAVTNIQQFPWNKILVDGNVISERETLIGYSSNAFGYPGLAVELPAGKHQIEFITKVPRIWSVLNAFSWLVLAGCVYICLAFKPVRLKES